MAERKYLYIDFSKNLEIGSTNKDDVYKESLKEQFNKIQRRLKIYGKEEVNFNKFLKLCFPEIMAIYYVSAPSFEVEEIEYRENNIIYNGVCNIYIRPKKTAGLLSIIPQKLDIFFIGDFIIKEEIISFVVKGIDLIDQSITKARECEIECNTVCAIKKNRRNQADYEIDNEDLYKSFLDRDMFLHLIEEICPVENMNNVESIFENWKKYLKFRKYYLEEQSMKNEKINKVDFIRAYSISRTEYKKNEEDYSEFLLDDIKSFIKKDEVILNKNVEKSIEISLIKIEIIKKLSEINQKLLDEKKISTYEKELRKFSRSSVALSSVEPNNKEKNVEEKILYIGDRLVFEVKDVYPDCSKIIDKFNKKVKEEEISIDNKYRKIIENKVLEYREKKNKELEELEKKDIEDYSKSLDNSLESDILKNKDQDVQREYQKQLNKIKNEYDKLRKENKKTYKKQKDRNLKNQEEIDEINQKEKDAISKIDISKLYIERNKKLKENYIKKREIEKDKKLEELCKEKEKVEKQIIISSIEKEKKLKKEELEQEKNETIEKINEELSERCFYIYFKLEDTKKIDNNELENFNFLIYDNRAEKKKIERQKKALNSLYRGYVKNPFLASYLFEAEKLQNNEDEIPELEYFSERLNDRQKEAVKRAIMSKGIFLLQGPPGTGKTEVIAEIATQYIKQGKKVLISSETHKAIDNVFERLPKIPEIRPLRLIPSTLTKETNYSPKKLVDNLYFNISNILTKKIKQYDNFNDMKNSFNEKMKELKFKYNKMLKLEKSYNNIEIEKKQLQKKLLDYDIEIEKKRKLKISFEKEEKEYETLLLQIENGNFNEEIDSKSRILANLISKDYSYIDNLDLKKIGKIYKLDIEQVEEELKLIEENKLEFSIEQKKKELRLKMNKLIDPDTYDPFPGKEEEYKKLKNELISLKNKQDKNDIDYSKCHIISLVPTNKISNNKAKNKILKEINDIKAEIDNFINEKKKEIDPEIDKLNNKIKDIENEIQNIKIEKGDLSSKKEELESDSLYKEFKEEQQNLKREIKRFFDEFEIYEEYKENNFEEAIDIIKKKWNNIQENQESLEKENKLKIPMYKNICKYLSDEEILEEDRISFTKKLFDNANIFGITCTSREYFSENSMEELRQYNLGDINIRNVGIDVVIIDEVSKSSFLELLMSALYGKTLILVGDHRQLPPLYDLKHLKESDFESLDSDIIDYSINKCYQKMYETSFFKELFEKVTESYKIMLNKQYRCHGDIMDVFNHFYNTSGKGLELGLSNQNNLKQHGLLIKEKNITLIDLDNHIYFINCNEYESKVDDDSSSIVNHQEADVVCKLLKLINEQYGLMLKKGDLKYEKNLDERKSIGVICTYRDQAQQIKNKIKDEKFDNFSKKREEKLIINTVDDFQGDERDIIIVSMVRNPKGNRYNTEFIDQFERINVALSRARCMLIIVGSENFLSKSSIDLPDINGQKELDKNSFPIYKEIIKTIKMKGKILQAIDIIGEEKNDK